MGDTPATPIITPDQTETTRAAGEALNNTNNIAEKTPPILSDIGLKAGLTANQMALLTSAFLGSTEAFDNFVNVDTTRLTTFNKQIDEFTKSLSKPGTIAADVTSGIKSLGDMLTRTAGSTKEASDIQSTFGNIIKAGGGLTVEVIKKLGDYAKTILSTADDQLKLQSAMVQQAAAMGTLGKLYDQTGNNLEHFNSLSQHQADVIQNVQKIMGGSEATWAEYASQLNQVPGILDNMLKSTDKSSASNTIFARTVEYAVGAGRKYQDVVADMKQGIMDFGLEQEEALKYTARMSEASAMLGIPIDDLRGALNSSSEAFRMYATNGDNAAKMTQGMQQSMVDYMQSLKDVGVPMRGQIELANQMATAVSSMGIAQKAFLSGQTGGPGGLMGAFQIDKMMKDGDIKGVMDKVKDSIQRQIGHMVTVDEAAKSPMAAAQMTKQIMMLRQGPLGSFAKSDVEAERLSEAMIKGKGLPDQKTQFGAPGNLTLDNLTNKGIEIAQTSQDYLSQINTTLNEMKTSSGSRVLGMVQQFTARSGETSGTGNKQTDLQKHLRDFQDTGIHPPAVNSSTQALQDVDLGKQGLTDLKNAFLASVSSGNQSAMNENAKKLQDQLKQKREEAPSDKGMQQMTEHVGQLVNRAMSETHGINLFHPPDNEPSINAGEQVGKAAATMTHRHAAIGEPNLSGGNAANKTGINAGANNQGAIPVTLAGGNMTVHLTSTCPHCKGEIHDSVQGQINNPASSKPNTHNGWQ